ncbi:hypothetical protein JYB64_15245 [Algoriphagus aestuarii]|nr:hypothetical protein [Algoriphagus aestuarii]
MILKSRFNRRNSFVIPSCIIAILLLLAGMVGYISFLDVSNGKVDSIFKTPIYASLFLALVVIILIIQYLLYLKTIIITDQGIKFSSVFSSEFISWKDVQELKILDRSTIMGGTSRESTTLKLKNGRNVIIPELFYENIGNIRKALVAVFEAKQTGTPIKFSSYSEARKNRKNISQKLDISNMPQYTGNHFLSFNGIVFYGLIIASVVMVATLGNTQNLGLIFLICLILLLVYYGFLGYQAHYFYLDSKYLVIRNHMWPWVNEQYKTEEIQEVVIDTPYRLEKSLRIVSTDFESKLYPAGSLKKKTWELLESKFEELNLPIRKDSF